jgi:hypothetical protein
MLQELLFILNIYDYLYTFKPTLCFVFGNLDEKRKKMWKKKKNGGFS